MIKVDLGSKNIAKSDWKTKHIPIWNLNGSIDRALPKDLSFAPDLTVSLYQKGWFGSENVVGEINIPLTTINEDYSQPKFYQFYSYGETKGKLLAIFNIIESDPKVNKEKEFGEAARANSNILTHADISLSLVGIRNMAGVTNDMKMEIQLLYLKPNEDSSYLAETMRPVEDQNDEDEKDDKEDNKNRKETPHDEEDSMGSLDDDDEELGLHNKKEMLERKSVNPELMQELKKQHDENNKKLETKDMENNVTRTGAEINKELNEIEQISPISQPNTTCPNF